MADPFLGEVRVFGFGYAPRGWAFCNGQLLPIAENTALFSLLSTVYGGDGRVTFALPDLQARVPMHPGRGPGLTERKLGQRVGTQTVALSKDQIPSHTHTDQCVRASGENSEPTGLYPAAAISEDIYKKNPTSPVNMATQALKSTGESEGHLNMQPCLAVNFCICLDGAYPNRS